MEVDGISEWLWGALWDFLSVVELCFSTTEPILGVFGEGWLDQSFYPWFSSNSLLFSLLRLLAGY